MFCHYYDVKDMAKFISMVVSDGLNMQNYHDYMVVSNIIGDKKLFKLMSNLFMTEYIANPQEMKSELIFLRENQIFH